MEIWVVRADRYRNPDEDLPADFDRKRKAQIKSFAALPDLALLCRSSYGASVSYGGWS